MADTKTYNGWANWATWNVALWVDNEEGLYRERRRIVRCTPKGRLADALEEWVKECFPQGTPDMASEGKAKNYNDVDWDEIMEAWYGEEYPDGEEDEDNDEEE